MGVRAFLLKESRGRAMMGVGSAVQVRGYGVWMVIKLLEQ